MRNYDSQIGTAQPKFNFITYNFKVTFIFCMIPVGILKTLHMFSKEICKFSIKKPSNWSQVYENFSSFFLTVYINFRVLINF